MWMYTKLSQGIESQDMAKVKNRLYTGNGKGKWLLIFLVSLVIIVIAVSVTIKATHTSSAKDHYTIKWNYNWDRSVLMLSAKSPYF